MAKDTIDSLAVIPDPTNNFDEVWMVVNRANGRMVERMSLRLAFPVGNCPRQADVMAEDQIFLDSAVTYESGEYIEKMVVNSGVITLTISGHNFNNGDTVVLRNIFGYPEYENQNYTVQNADTNTFELA